MPLIVLKLGGSIISYKNGSRPGFRKRTTGRLVKEIIKARNHNNFQLIIVHGTGSFGHPPAHKYNLAKGITADPTKQGFSISKRQGFLLNNYLWEVLEKHSLPAITIPPFSIIKSSNGKIINADITKIKELIKIDRTPLLFGDEVLDSGTGYSICSSDQIAVFLASKLKPDLLLFATDVDGVYDVDPKKTPSAKLFNEVNIHLITEINKISKPNNKFDVSGEMRGKLTSLFELSLSKKTKIRIFSGLKPNNLYKALIGNNVGTTIVT